MLCPADFAVTDVVPRLRPCTTIVPTYVPETPVKVCDVAPATDGSVLMVPIVPSVVTVTSTMSG